MCVRCSLYVSLKGYTGYRLTAARSTMGSSAARRGQLHVHERAVVGRTTALRGELAQQVFEPLHNLGERRSQSRLLLPAVAQQPTERRWPATPHWKAVAVAADVLLELNQRHAAPRALVAA